ncbi:MAG TPA: PHB depolymerase family esterase [Steroidobacteraceae bacterium]|nr:PHB depolymerase family esterase [Steroidobacteraceae bacterium]
MRAPLAATLAALAACSQGPSGEKLPRLDIIPGSLTVSGVSSGGYMATQYQVAYSQSVAGAGIIGAGPWLCARGIVTRALNDCLAGETGGPDERPLVAALRASAALRIVDDPAGLAADRVWIFHGAKDETMGAAVSDSLLRFYKAFIPLERVHYETQVPAAHGFPTAGEGGACGAGEPPWILDCGYDAAGEVLKHLYGGLAEPSAELSGELREFGQSRYVESGARASMAETGLLYVPRECAEGASCRLHVAFHGCSQGIDTLGRSFARQAGYNRWADANRIVVLYPQAKASAAWPINPRGCWDWWGYSGADYAARSGAQLSAVRRMVEALGG